MITIDWGWENMAILDTNFSEHPEHKCAHMFKMQNGNFYAYPNLESYGMMMHGSKNHKEKLFVRNRSKFL